MHADLFLSQYSDAVIVALTGLRRKEFVMVYDKYCGRDTPICKSEPKARCRAIACDLYRPLAHDRSCALLCDLLADLCISGSC